MTMKDIFTLKEITKALGLSRARVEQWISRGDFRPPDQPIIGKARDWDLGEAMRLALFVQLVDDVGFSIKQASFCTQLGLHGFNNNVAFFVVWQGLVEVPIKDEAGKRRKLYTPSWNSHIILSSGDLQSFVQNPDVYFALVVNLNNLEMRVRAALNSAG